MIFDAAFLSEYRAEFCVGEQLLEIFVGIALLYKTVKGSEMQAEVEIVDETLLVVADVHESRVERRKQFLDTSKKNAAYRKTVPLVGFPCEFNKPVIFHQGYTHFRRGLFNDKVFFDFLFVHCVIYWFLTKGIEARRISRTGLYRLFLLVSVEAQAFFTLVRSHFMSFSLLSARHNDID